MFPAYHSLLKLENIYQDDSISVGIDEKLGLIYVKWQKHVNSKEFREYFLKFANIAIEKKMKYWLSDARAMHYLEFSDQNWLIQNMIPLLKLSSLEKFARVSTKEGFAMMDISRVYANIEQLHDMNINTEFDFFFTIDAAIEWLFAKA